jgi:hypothetical protein
VADDFASRYGNLLAGSYDCVDRIVLSACFGMGHSPGGFRTWWRQLHGGSDDQLDDTHLIPDGRPVRPPGQGLGPGP